MSAHGLAPTGDANNQGAQPDGRYNPKADSTGGELYDIGALNIGRTVSAIRRYDPLVVGTKVRVSSMLTSESDDPTSIESEEFDRALDVASQAGVPLAVHHANSTIDLDRCPGHLRSGDIYTHCFSAQEREGMDLNGTITLDGATIFGGRSAGTNLKSTPFAHSLFMGGHQVLLGAQTGDAMGLRATGLATSRRRKRRTANKLMKSGKNS